MDRGPQRGSAAAQEISVQANVDRHRVSMNGRLELDLQVSGTQQVQPPDLKIDGFDVHYAGPSTNISIVNGAVSSSVTHVYWLLPRKAGTFTIGPLAVPVNGQTLRTDPITVEVVPTGTPGLSGAPSGSEPMEEPSPTPSVEDALQLQLGVDTTRAYVNQAVPLRLQLLVGRVGVRGIEMPTLQADGFLIKPFGQPTQSQVMIEGQPTTLLEFNATAIPIRPGRLTLGPASLNAQVAVPRRRTRSRTFGDPFEDVFSGSLFDDFFTQAMLQPVTARAEPVTIDVSPLPQEGKPSSFSGAMGQFTLDAAATPTTVTAGEPVTLTMTIDGQGNLEGAGAPAVQGDLSAWRVYDARPKAAPAAEQTAQRKVFEQVLIPRDASVREIPSVAWSYFDPAQGRYQTLTKPPIPLAVNPAPAQPPTPLVETRPAAPSAPTTPEPLGRDISYIKEALGPVRQIGSQDIPPWMWVAFLTPLGLLLLSETFAYRRRQLQADPALARASRAMKRARAGGQDARRLAREGKIDACYAEIFRVVQRYIGDRLNMTSEGLTKAELERALQQRGAPAEPVASLAQVLERCDAARFAPASVAAAQADETIRIAESSLQQLERWKPA